MNGRLAILGAVVALVATAGVGSAVVGSGNGGATAVVANAGDAVGDAAADWSGGSEANDVEPASRDDGGDERQDDGGGSGESDAQSGEPDDDGSNSGDETEGAGTGADDSGNAATRQTTFAFEIESVEECGQTCRTVTVALHNRADDRASDVSVHTQIYSGKDASSGDRVWQQRRDVGTVDAGGTARATETVNLGWMGGIAVKRANGWITVVATVESAEHSREITIQRDVL